MWTFKVREGQLWNDGDFVGGGYSGNGPDLNNPDKESDIGHGPLPRGLWIIGKWQDHPHLGPLVAPLTPIFDTNRSDIWIHGDNAEMNHTASDGCLILNKLIRHSIHSSGEDQLTVTD